MRSYNGSESVRVFGSGGRSPHRVVSYTKVGRDPRALARAEVREQLAEYEQVGKFEARAEAYSRSVLVVEPLQITTTYVMIAECRCGCHRVYQRQDQE